jgi:uncharacterized membrane protein
MKIKLYFDKGNLGRLAVAMIFAAVLFWKIGFSVWAQNEARTQGGE